MGKGARGEGVRGREGARKGGKEGGREGIPWNSLMAVAKAPRASRSRKLVGSSRTRRWG